MNGINFGYARPRLNGSVAQLDRAADFNQQVGGSSPPGIAIFLACSRQIKPITHCVGYINIPVEVPMAAFQQFSGKCLAYLFCQSRFMVVKSVP